MDSKFRILFILLALPAIIVSAQNSNTTSVSIKANATVMEKIGIEIITMKNMDIDIKMALDGRIYISALRNPNAAIILVKGKSDAKFRVHFQPVMKIKNSHGNGSLLMHYEVYGYPTDNQRASEPIDAIERILQMSSDGNYFFWIGGNIDIKNAYPGNYDGEFTIQIEYI
jgi:hypothetical protein